MYTNKQPQMKNPTKVEERAKNKIKIQNYNFNFIQSPFKRRGE